jgi:hypothetical protein
MTVLLVLAVLVSIAALAPFLGTDTRTPELLPQH